jgi:hypothetical protein
MTQAGQVVVERKVYGQVVVVVVVEGDKDIACPLSFASP